MGLGVWEGLLQALLVRGVATLTSFSNGKFALKSSETYTVACYSRHPCSDLDNCLQRRNLLARLGNRDQIQVVVFLIGGGAATFT